MTVVVFSLTHSGGNSETTSSPSGMGYRLSSKTGSWHSLQLGVEQHL